MKPGYQREAKRKKRPRQKVVASIPRNACFFCCCFFLSIRESSSRALLEAGFVRPTPLRSSPRSTCLCWTGDTHEIRAIGGIRGFPFDEACTPTAQTGSCAKKTPCLPYPVVFDPSPLNGLVSSRETTGRPMSPSSEASTVTGLLRPMSRSARPVW